VQQPLIAVENFFVLTRARRKVFVAYARLKNADELDVAA
jgi:hypothetical protein